MKQTEPQEPPRPSAPGADPVHLALTVSVEIAQALASEQDPEAFPAAVLGPIGRHYDLIGAGVFLLSAEGDDLVFIATQSRADFWPFIIEGGLPLARMGALGKTLTSGQSTVAQSPPQTASEVPSWQIALPLQVPGEMLGALDLRWERQEAPTEHEIAALEALARHIGLALHDARVRAELLEANAVLTQKVGRLRKRAHTLRDTYRHLQLLDEAKSDFITVASHELRTPLTVLSGYSQMLLGDPQISGDPYRSQLVKGIQGGADRLRVLIDDMLDMARIDNRALRLKPEPLFLSVLLNAIRAKLDSITAQRHITLTVDPGLDALPLIEADTDAIRKVFYHLMVNAVKYTPDGGTVRVRGRSLSPELTGYPEPCIEIVVSDTGIGVDPTVKELIFDKFYRTGKAATHSSGITKFKGGGPGLGLSIARGIVEAHGGRIWVESTGYDEEQCPGSDFHVILPVQPEIGPEIRPGKLHESTAET